MDFAQMSTSDLESYEEDPGFPDRYKEHIQKILDQRQSDIAKEQERLATTLRAAANRAHRPGLLATVDSILKNHRAAIAAINKEQP